MTLRDANTVGLRDHFWYHFKTRTSFRHSMPETSCTTVYVLSMHGVLFQAESHSMKKFYLLAFQCPAMLPAEFENQLCMCKEIFLLSADSCCIKRLYLNLDIVYEEIVYGTSTDCDAVAIIVRMPRLNLNLEICWSRFWKRVIYLGTMGCVQWEVMTNGYMIWNVICCR